MDTFADIKVKDPQMYEKFKAVAKEKGILLTDTMTPADLLEAVNSISIVENIVAGANRAIGRTPRIPSSNSEKMLVDNIVSGINARRSR